MSVAKEKDLNMIAWFENCLVGQIMVSNEYFAIGYSLELIADEKQKSVGTYVNEKIKEVISNRIIKE
jgi:hypothetical protein